MILSSCANQIAVVPTSAPPTQSPTPFSTSLPTVPTQIPPGLLDVNDSLPYLVAAIPPGDGTGTELRKALEDATGNKFKINALSNNNQILAALCGGVPAIGIVDGWVMLAAQVQGCAEPVLKFQRGSATGIRADIVVAQGKVTAFSGLKGKDFCRVGNDTSLPNWALPILMIRNSGTFDPYRELGKIQTFPDIPTMLKVVANGKCSAGIPHDTLSQYNVEGISDITRAVTVLASSPEIPFGGVVISSRMPKDTADKIVKLLSSDDTAVTKLKDLGTFDSLVGARVSDLSSLLAYLQRAGFDFNSLG